MSIHASRDRSSDESQNPEFRCPACRARQPRQNQCRRCGADLSLLVRIHNRIDYLLADPSDTHQRELAVLDPKRIMVQ